MEYIYIMARVRNFARRSFCYLPGGISDVLSLFVTSEQTASHKVRGGKEGLV